MDAKLPGRSHITIDDRRFFLVMPCRSLERLGGSRTSGSIDEASKQDSLANREIFADIGIDYVLDARTGTHTLDDIVISFQGEQHPGAGVAQLVMNLSLI